MKGERQYLSPRVDGATSFIITDEICDAYESLEKTEFDQITPDEIALTRGMFASDDEVVRQGDEFELYYPGRGIRYPGRHLPVFPELKKYLVPIAVIG